jgi:hypothetical protein
MFIPVQLATLRGSEEGHLVLVNEAVAAVLVRILPEPPEGSEEGGSCRLALDPAIAKG